MSKPQDSAFINNQNQVIEDLGEIHEQLKELVVALANNEAEVVVDQNITQELESSNSPPTTKQTFTIDVSHESGPETLGDLSLSQNEAQSFKHADPVNETTVTLDLSRNPDSQHQNNVLDDTGDDEQLTATDEPQYHDANCEL